MATIKKEGRDLVSEALQDAKSLKDAAVESAKNKLVEELTPAVRRLLNESVRGALKSEQSRAPDFKGPEGGTQQQKKDYDPDGSITPELHEDASGLEEALKEFFTPEEAKSMANEATEKKSSKKSSKNEAAEEKKSSKRSAMAEEIEINETELRKVYEAALQTEVQTKKGFSDLVGGGELDQASKESGILPKKGGEKHFEEEEPPAKKDWIPEGKVKEMLRAGLKENKDLRENLRKAVAMVETLGKKLHEVNLFNAKVLHVNKLLNSGARLTREQKTYVMESIDKARSISEVKMVYETIVKGFATAQAVNESRNVRPPKANAQGARRAGAPDQRVLSESVDHETGAETKFDRLRELAGIVNGKR